MMRKKSLSPRKHLSTNAWIKGPLKDGIILHRKWCELVIDQYPKPMYGEMVSGKIVLIFLLNFCHIWWFFWSALHRRSLGTFKNRHIYQKFAKNWEKQPFSFWTYFGIMNSDTLMVYQKPDSLYQIHP